jgi:cytochrome c oxidase cbb3-type subunit III
VSDDRHVDEVSGIQTTGHVWDDDLRELNRPLPRWWIWVFYLTVIWSVGYWIVYPAWPFLSGYTPGIWGFSQRREALGEVAAGHAAQTKYRDAIAKLSLADIRNDPDLLNFATTGGRIAFLNNCAGCHGRNAQGSIGFPNLTAGRWLWGGKLEDIYKTIRVGIRSTSPETRQNQMPHFGTDKILDPQQINDTAEFVLSWSGGSQDQAAAGRGKQVFADNCVACHGPAGKGNTELGAPDLTTAIWLYGGRKEDIVHSIEVGHAGVMPSWEGRLDDVTIKQLAVYVYGLGGGQP